MSLKVYFDYNIYVAISNNKIIYKKTDIIDIYYSVAHVEEFYKAYSNSSEENREELIRLKRIIKSQSFNGIILNPSINFIEAKTQSFESCFDLIKNRDTRMVVQENGSVYYKNYKVFRENLLEQDPSSKFNSKCSIEEIWERPEVRDELNQFDEYYRRYVADYYQSLYSVYKDGAYSIPLCFPSNYSLKRNCLKKEKVSFQVLEMVFEFLNNILCKCGYYKDQTERTTQSGIHDVTHLIYATYCDFFITNDHRLLCRAKAIYYFLGIDIRVFSFDEFVNFIK